MKTTRKSKELNEVSLYHSVHVPGHKEFSTRLTALVRLAPSMAMLIDLLETTTNRVGPD
jgi:hypothetical protein